MARTEFIKSLVKMYANHCILIITIFVWSITGCSAKEKTNKIFSISCCVETQLKKIGEVDAIPVLLKDVKHCKIGNWNVSIDNDSIVLSKGSEKVKLNDIDSIQSWIESAELKSLHAYSLAFQGDNYLLFSSKIIGASGLSTNFYQWLIVNLNTLQAITTDLVSLSDSSKMFYIQHHLLNMITLEYGDAFYLKKRNWDNPPIKIIFYRFQNNRVKIINQVTTYCNCHY